MKITVATEPSPPATPGGERVRRSRGRGVVFSAQDQQFPHPPLRGPPSPASRRGLLSTDISLSDLNVETQPSPPAGKRGDRVAVGEGAKPNFQGRNGVAIEKRYREMTRSIAAQGLTIFLQTRGSCSVHDASMISGIAPGTTETGKPSTWTRNAPTVLLAHRSQFQVTGAISRQTRQVEFLPDAP